MTTINRIILGPLLIQSFGCAPFHIEIAAGCIVGGRGLDVLWVVLRSSICIFLKSFIQSEST